ncbi:MAG: hypothetical protein MI919_40590 [Holophagales bacterium]|nr:hypothetical protein [Holophagales bacterium]
MPRPIPFAVLAVLLAGASVGLAQPNLEVNAGLQLDLSQPGARSLGMGGAFLGLADDATAAYTNPAGLANLSTPEIALEGRAWDFITTYTDAGFSIFDGGRLDDSGLIESEVATSTEGFSFASFVWPHGRWVFAIYRHQLADFETSFETGGVDFLLDGTSYLIFPVRASTDLEIAGTGVAAGFRLSDSISLGLGVINYEMSWESTTRRFQDSAFRGIDFWVNQQDIEADDEAISASLGFEWKLAERWRLGGVYRWGAEFDFSTNNTAGPATGIEGFVFDSDEGSYRVPDVYGLGLAYKSASFRVLLDWVRVEYSTLTENPVNAFDDEVTLDRSASRLGLEDADELHLGFEYVFVDVANPLALRLGAWLDPDHEIRYEGPIETSQDAATALLFRPGDDELHYTGGVGVSFADGKFELNAAVDLSDRTDTASLSLVWRFL